MLDKFSAEPLVSDPVFSDVEFTLRRIIYPLGFPVRLETNSAEVLHAAFEGWGQFAQAFDVEPARICLGVSESDTMLSSIRSHFRSREHLMSFTADPENSMVCDFNRRFAFGWVTRRVASDHPLLRYRFLLPAAYMLIEQVALVPLHGALIVRAGCGVLLCGESFAGKSTLAYAACRAGWVYVSDDATFLVRDRDDRYAIGDRHAIRFREGVKHLFPELNGRLARVRPNGKIGIEMFTRELAIETAAGCSIEHVVFLDRCESGPVRLRHYPKDRALEEWESHLSFGTSEVRAAQKRCCQHLLDAGVWELEYADLDDALQRLEQLVDSGR
jgi:hypothetical protein